MITSLISENIAVVGNSCQKYPETGLQLEFLFYFYIPVFPFNSSIFLLASVLPIPSVGTFSPAFCAIAAIYPVCFPVA